MLPGWLYCTSLFSKFHVVVTRVPSVFLTRDVAPAARDAVSLVNVVLSNLRRLEAAHVPGFHVGLQAAQGPQSPGLSWVALLSSDSGIGRSHRAAKAAATSGSPRLAKVNPCAERARPRVAKTLVRELNCYLMLGGSRFGLICNSAYFSASRAALRPSANHLTRLTA